jgi:hypothetical protein
MQKKNNTLYDKCKVAAQRTIDLIDHRHTPDHVSDAVLETLVVMSAESRMQIWHEKTGISLETLAALYTLYERGAGYRRSRKYGRYETKRLERERRERQNNGQS